MKRIVSFVISAACLLAALPAAKAQQCNFLAESDLQGTYTMIGSGWIDLAKMLAGIPGLPPLPAGFIPMSWVGTLTLDHAGGGSGSVSMNSGGTQLSGSLVNWKHTVKPDCTILATFYLKSNELPGVTLGPVTRLLIPVFRQQGIPWLPAALELRMIFMGTPPGTPNAPGVDSGSAYRISLQH